MRQTRIWQHAGDVGRSGGVRPSVSDGMFPLTAGFAFEDDPHAVCGRTLFGDNVAGIVMAQFHASRKPRQVLVGKIGEDRDCFELPGKRSRYC